MYKSLAIGIVGIHMVLWILVPYYTLYTVGLDSVEMIAWGRSLDWGYFKHPPLPSWVVIAFESFLPTNIAVFVASQVFIAFTAMGVWVLAKAFVSESSRFMATILVLVFPHTTWISAEWNHHLVQLPFWVWTVVAFHQVCRHRGNSLWAWAFMGGVAALGLYGKYSLGILYISIFLYAILWRRYIFNIWGLWVFTVVFVGVLAPHAVWLKTVDFAPLSYMQGRFEEAATWQRLGSFWGAFIVNLTFVVLGIGIARRKFKFRSLSVPLGHFLVYMTCMPLIVVTILAIILNISVYSTWNYPFLSLVPLMFIWWCEKRGYTMSALWGSIWVVGVGGAVAGYYGYYYTVNLNRGHYPAQAIATQAQQIWRYHVNTPLAYVAGNQWTAGSVAVYAADKPKFIVDNDVAINNSIDFNDVKTKGYMYIWRADETPNVSSFTATGTIVVPYHPPFADKDHTVNYGIIAAVR